MADSTTDEQPSLLWWGLSVAASAGLTGMLCCVAPMVLFMFGIMGGTYAISFADFFYQDVSVLPEAGKLILFPPFWTHKHRGSEVLAKKKYIATTWIVFA